MRKMLLFICCCLTAILLVSCGSAAEMGGDGVEDILRTPDMIKPDNPKIELRLWSFHQAREFDFWQWLAEQYEKEHPDIDIKVEFVTSDDYFSSTRLLSSFASGQGPDLFFVSAATLKRFAEADVLYPLTSLFTPEVKADFDDAALASVTAGGDIYAVPFETELLGLFYNKAMFRDHGISPPRTWEEMRRAAELLSSSKVSGLTVETYEGVYQNFSWLPFLWQTGANLLTSEGKDSGLSGAQALQFYSFFSGMVKEGLVNLRPSRPTTDIGILANGETAMQISGTWNIRMLETEFADQPIGVVPLPVPEGGSPITISGGWKLATNKHSVHAKEAADFLMWAFAGKTEIPLKWVNETKFAYSPRKSVMEAGSKDYRRGLRSVFTNQIFGTEREEPQLPEEVNRIFSDSIQALLFSKEPPEGIAGEADRRIKAYLGAIQK